MAITVLYSKKKMKKFIKSFCKTNVNANNDNYVKFGDSFTRLVNKKVEFVLQKFS